MVLKKIILLNILIAMKECSALGKTKKGEIIIEYKMLLKLKSIPRKSNSP
jgi:hypothetical protein